MSNKLRRRAANNVRERDGTESFSMASFPSGAADCQLTAPALLAASPINSGPAMKFHVPTLYSFLPLPVQRLLSSWCCPRSWAPRWKRRHLISVGGYFYRFKDERGSSPKGSPIPLETLEVRILARSNGVDGDHSFIYDRLPTGFHCIFEVTSLGKTQYFAVESREEAMTWANSLWQARSDTITKNMGHSKDIPYPKLWDAADAAALRLRAQKERIRMRVEAMNAREQEMTSLGGTMDDPACRGYFG